MPIWELAIIFVCLSLGGVLKGATGAGAPILAVPALAAVYDVQFAIVVMLVPNLLTNITQAWQGREHRLDWRFLARFLGGGAAGVMAGTWLLTSLDAKALSLLVGLSVGFYVVLRLVKSDWHLSSRLAERMALPMGLFSGVLQGAAGLSAPVSLSFLNAMRLERRVFMSTVSMLFVTFVVVQLPILSLAGIITPMGLGASVLAMMPIGLSMPLGGYLARKLSRPVFDRVIMVLLGCLAVKMLLDAVT